jgi:putative membrane protein
MYVRNIRFSPLAYILMTILPIMHAIGAHYTFANVPSQWLSDLLSTDRNMYDRIAHASVGLYSFGILEYITIKKLTTSQGFQLSYALFAIMALAGAYELFEWRYAIISDPEAGLAILGSQGDIWDAQKDILMDTLGALIGI